MLSPSPPCALTVLSTLISLFLSLLVGSAVIGLYVSL